jgi:hypothetical protein
VRDPALRVVMAIQQNQPGEAEPTWQSVNVYALIQAFRTEYDAHMSGGNAYVAYSLVTYSEGPDLFLRGLEALLGSDLLEQEGGPTEDEWWVWPTPTLISLLRQRGHGQED